MKQKLLILLLVTGFAPALSAEEIKLVKKNFAHITFKNIPVTHYEFTPAGLDIRVDKSASGLIYAFKKPVSISGLMLQWRRQGDLLVRSAQHEASKQGDDNYLRIGLIVKGRDRAIPFFAPAWVKQVRKHLNSGFEKVIYLHLESRHKPGSSWKSPYTNEIDIKSIASKDTGSGFRQVDEMFAKPLSVVGLIVMSDGDNTKSSFRVQMKNLQVTRAKP